MIHSFHTVGSEAQELARTGVRISFWRRNDVIVTDPGRVLAAGRALQREHYPDDEVPVEVRIPDVATVVGVLVSCDDLLPLDDDEEALGLVRAGSVTEVVTVERVLAEYAGLDWPEEPFDRSGLVP